MITVGMNYVVLEGKGKTFEDKFSDVLKVMDQDPGHIKTHLYSNVWAGGEYLVVSEWKSQDAFSGFVGSDLFRQVTDWGKDHILSERPRHKVYS